MSQPHHNHSEDEENSNPSNMSPSTYNNYYAPRPINIPINNMPQSIHSIASSPSILSPYGSDFPNTMNEFIGSIGSLNIQPQAAGYFSGPSGPPISAIEEQLYPIQDNIDSLVAFSMSTHNFFPQPHSQHLQLHHAQIQSDGVSVPIGVPHHHQSRASSPPPLITVQEPETESNVENHGWFNASHSPSSPFGSEFPPLPASGPGSPASSHYHSDGSSMGYTSPYPGSPLTPTSGFGEEPEIVYPESFPDTTSNRQEGNENKTGQDGSDRRSFSLAQQKQMFMDMITEAPTAKQRGAFIPQIFYEPHNASDRRRYVDEVELDAPIIFAVHSPFEYGMPLREARQQRFNRLEGRDDLCFVGHGPSISIRLSWTGYKAWSRQIPTKDFRSIPGPITKSRLAINVARSVERFIKERQGQPCEVPQWKVGPGHITLDDLLLVSMHQNSKGSWQIHLRLATPRNPNIQNRVHPTHNQMHGPATVSSTPLTFPG